MNHRIYPLASMCLLLALTGCTLTGHPMDDKPAPGKVSSSAEMERMLSQPGVVQLEVVNSADWSVALGGALNLKSAKAAKAGLQDHEEPIQVYAYLLRHPTRGNFIVDTGVSRKVVAQPSEYGLNWLLRKVLNLEKLRINTSTAEMLAPVGGKIAGVMMTHLHLDHVMGMPDVADDVPLYVGAGEAQESTLNNAFVRSATDTLLKGKRGLHAWRFQPDPQHQFEGVVDVFEDGSVFAIQVPGHTAGSTAFLIRTTRGPVLLTGDACITRWGWEQTVEPGEFTNDHDRNLKSLKSMKALVARHPQIEVRLGHQH